MIRIEHPHMLWALLLILPCLIVWYYYVRGDQRWSLAFLRSPMTSVLRIRFICWTVAMICLVLALVNPQYGYKETKATRLSSDIYIALDISQSMDCQDLKPSRLERAKKIGERLIKGLRTERVGLILFAAEAYVQMPLTHDYRTALVFLKNASTTQAGVQGTTVTDVIDLATRSSGDDDLRSRILVILSDGEAHGEEVVDIAKSSFEAGVYQFAVGVGTTDGGFIPRRVQDRTDYLRDDKDAPVLTRLDPSLLQDVASAGGGQYFHHTETQDLLEAIQERVSRIERKQYDAISFTARASYYRWLLLPAFMCAVLALGYRRALY